MTTESDIFIYRIVKTNGLDYTVGQPWPGMNGQPDQGYPGKVLFISISPKETTPTAPEVDDDGKMLPPVLQEVAGTYEAFSESSDPNYSGNTRVARIHFEQVSEVIECWPTDLARRMIALRREQMRELFDVRVDADEDEPEPGPTPQPSPPQAPPTPTSTQPTSTA